MSSWQHVVEHCHPGNMCSSTVILSTYGRALSFWQQEVERCHPGNMWSSTVILATCGRALSSWQHVVEHCHSGNVWSRIVILATCGRALSWSKMQTHDFFFHISNLEHKIFKINFSLWQKINKEDNFIIRNANLLSNYFLANTFASTKIRLYFSNY